MPSTRYLANNGVGCFTLCPDLRREKGRCNHLNKNGNPLRSARSVTPYELRSQQSHGLLPRLDSESAAGNQSIPSGVNHS